jgi:hypothetical protein
MCREQLESINQKLSMPPTYKIKKESKSEQKTQHWGYYKMNQTSALPFAQTWD